jgi:hypothetical protein
MSGEGSSLFEEIFELSVFLADLVVLYGFTVFGDFDGSLAGEGNSEDVSQFEDEKFFGSRVSV